MSDLRLAARSLLRTPGFSAVVVLTLALGIGANTAIFGVVDAVILHPLPFAEPDRLITLYATSPRSNRNAMSYPNFQDIRGARTFEALAMWKPDFFVFTTNDGVEQLIGQRVSADYFAVLGVQPLLGRAFDATEDQRGGSAVAILGEGTWKSRFSASRTILGRTLTLDGRVHTIVGVVPEHVRILTPERSAANDVFVPIGQGEDPVFLGRGSASDQYGLGRLARGVSLTEAGAEISKLARDLERTYPEFNTGVGVNLVPLADVLVGTLRPTVMALLGAVGCVLLIACANVANLFLLRSTARTREFAVRLALGANRSQLLRQVITESLLLAGAGGACGLALASPVTHSMLLAFPDTMPPITDISVNAIVVAFASAASLISALLIGLWPAFALTRQTVHPNLKPGTCGGITRHRAQRGFVVAQIALTLVLLAGAALMFQTLLHLWTIEPGFSAEHVLTFRTSLSPERAASAATIRATYRDIDERLGALPGVESSSIVFGGLPLTGSSTAGFRRDDEPAPATPAAQRVALFNAVGPDYFATMRIRLLRGRTFAPQDDVEHPNVAVIDEVFASTVFPNENPIGRRIQFGGFKGALEVIGLVAHVRHSGLDTDDQARVRAQLYIPYMQLPDFITPATVSGIGTVVRSALEPAAVMSSVRQAVATVDRGAIVHDEGSMTGHVTRSLAPRRLALYLLSAFAATALLLSAIGIYGVMSFATRQRTREIGLRTALGAQPGQILRLVLGDGQRMALTGVGIGVVATLFAAQLLSTLLYGVSASDPWTLAAVALLLWLVALAAGVLPARHAMRLDPTVALRAE